MGESINAGGKAVPFKTIELVVTKKKLNDGTFKFQSIDKVKLSSMLDFNPMLAGVEPVRSDESPAVFAGLVKELGAEDTRLIKDLSTSSEAAL